MIKTTKVGRQTIIYNPELSNINVCEIGDNCKIHAPVWIGDYVIIGNRVRIQAFTYIGMGSVVLCDIPSFEVWAGNPAKKIK